MNVSFPGFNEKLDGLKFDSISPKSDEEESSETLDRAVLNASRFKVNDAVGKLFGSCVSNLTFNSPFYPPQRTSARSLSPGQSKESENRYSSFTKRIEETKTPLFTLPSPEKGGIKQSLSNEEFNKRKDLCRHERSVSNFLVGHRSLQTPCFSLKSGMSDEQKEEFHKHIQNVNQEIHFRNATAPLVVLGAATRKTVEVITESVSDSVNQFCTQNPINQMICTKVKGLSSTVYRKGVGKVPDAIKKPVGKVLRAHHEFVEREARENAVKYGVGMQYTRDFYSGVLDASVGVTYRATAGAWKLVKRKPLLPQKSLSDMVFESESSYLRSIPSVSNGFEFEKTCQELAKNAKRGVDTEHLTYYKDGVFGSVLRVGKGRKSVVIKTADSIESFEELLGSYFFSSLNLTEIHFTRPINIFKGSKNLMIVKPYASGKTLNSMIIEQVKKTAAPLKKFPIQSGPLLEGIKQVAKAYNELQFVSAKYRIPLSVEIRRVFLNPKSFLDEIKGVNLALKKLHLPTIVIKEDQIISLLNKLLHSNEYAAFSLGDVGLNNFVYSKARKQLTYIDGMSLSYSVSSARQPMGMLGNDLVMLIDDMLDVSITNGMAFSKADYLVKHFLNHLQEPVKPAYLLKGKIGAVNSILQEVSLKDKFRLQQLKKLVEQINKDSAFK